MKVLLAALALTVSHAAAGAVSGTGFATIDSRYSRAADAEDVVLEVRVSGGFGKALGHRFRIYGDGRLEEMLIRSRDTLATLPVRLLPFSPTARDEILRSLVEAGVPGSTDEDLVAEVAAHDPRIRQLVRSSDCTKEHIRLLVYERRADTGELLPVETHLRLECSDTFERIYPYSRKLVALARMVRSLLTLSHKAGWN